MDESLDNDTRVHPEHLWHNLGAIGGAVRHCWHYRLRQNSTISWISG